MKFCQKCKNCKNFENKYCIVVNCTWFIIYELDYLLKYLYQRLPLQVYIHFCLFVYTYYFKEIFDK
jgi:Zn-dependent alcohol dehydrogenase